MLITNNLSAETMETKEEMNEQLTKIADGWMQKAAPTFNDLSESIIQTHQSAQYSAIKAINQMATLRNWLIGCYSGIRAERQ